MTYTRARPDHIVPWCEKYDVPILENTVHRWSDRTEQINHMWEYQTPHAIDAGGYNVQSAWVNGNPDGSIEEERQTAEPFYPWSLEEYHEWLTEYSDEFTWATPMDYSLDDQFDSLWSAEKRIEATKENTLKHFDLDPEYTILPVLQGRDVSDFVEFYEFLEDHGLPTDYVGVGSIAARSMSMELVSLERRLREQLGDVKLHGFGIKASAYRNGASFDTADSNAWVYSPSNGKIIIPYRDGDDVTIVEEWMRDDDKTRKIQSFKNYFAYVTWLKDGEPAVPDVHPRDPETGEEVEWPDRHAEQREMTQLSDFDESDGNGGATS